MSGHYATEMDIKGVTPGQVRAAAEALGIPHDVHDQLLHFKVEQGALHFALITTTPHGTVTEIHRYSVVDSAAGQE